MSTSVCCELTCDGFVSHSGGVKDVRPLKRSAGSMGHLARNIISFSLRLKLFLKHCYWISAHSRWVKTTPGSAFQLFRVSYVPTAINYDWSWHKFRLNKFDVNPRTITLVRTNYVSTTIKIMITINKVSPVEIDRYLFRGNDIFTFIAKILKCNITFSCFLY